MVDLYFVPQFTHNGLGDVLINLVDRSIKCTDGLFIFCPFWSNRMGGHLGLIYKMCWLAFLIFSQVLHDRWMDGWIVFFRKDY